MRYRIKKAEKTFKEGNRITNDVVLLEFSASPYQTSGRKKKYPLCFIYLHLFVDNYYMVTLQCDSQHSCKYNYNSA
jgi:hypothetical protein